MKKIILTLLSCILIFLLIYIDSLIPESKLVPLGIYSLIPIFFITQGVLCRNAKNELVIGFLLSSITLLIYLSMLHAWFEIGSLAVVIIIYWSLGLIAYFFAKWWYSTNIESDKN